MVRLIPLDTSDHFGSIPLAIGLFVSVSALVALCAKHARTSRVSTKNVVITETNNPKIAPQSPLRSVPKQLITTISNKRIPFIYNRKGGDDPSESELGNRAGEGFGEGGLWQKKILMGEKCQPPEFSGVIYYDNCGKQISELPPRSPRASHLPSFSFPEVREAS